MINCGKYNTSVPKWNVIIIVLRMLLKMSFFYFSAACWTILIALLKNDFAFLYTTKFSIM